MPARRDLGQALLRLSEPGGPEDGGNLARHTLAQAMRDLGQHVALQVHGAALTAHLSGYPVADTLWITLDIQNERATAEGIGHTRRKAGRPHASSLPMSIKTRQHRVRDIRLSLGRGSVQGLPCVENVPDELLDIALVDERREDEALQANYRLPVVGFPVAVGHGDADAFAAQRPLV